MPADSAIAWTNRTWNVGAVGCTHVSPGCDHCYAETWHDKWNRIDAKNPGAVPAQYAQPFATVRRMRDALTPQLYAKRMLWPLTIAEPSLIFVNSMTDLFHHVVPEEDIRAALDVMRATPWHIYQILTKRGNRLARLGPSLDWPDNVWMGVSVENATFLPRLKQLYRGTPPWVSRFVSYEPALGPLVEDAHYPTGVIRLARELSENAVEWLICGAESGPGARPMDLDWARQARDACRVSYRPHGSCTSFFLKQFADDKGKKTQLPELDGRVWDEYPIDLKEWRTRVGVPTAADRLKRRVRLAHAQKLYPYHFREEHEATCIVCGGGVTVVYTAPPKDEAQAAERAKYLAAPVCGNCNLVARIKAGTVK